MTDSANEQARDQVRDAIAGLLARIAEAIDTSDWDAVAPLANQLAAAGWRPACPTCGMPMRWERDMDDSGEQWLWCGHCSHSYESDQFNTLTT
ncbi:hypothetical protein [Pimelobacter simplex]|uniref:hypothetical protein n=1 Tax=Nocardioides simplex TaxID=2045 RepID=UPI0021500CA3|nr:hypothetical protein [Pimelobacter simplex]UUW92993.1 hypothetical protein M0M43_30635 [Pimelobacter simplex]UUW99026.1 hypothetical protein M0M48_30655 [Pimelobacter simplex]